MNSMPTGGQDAAPPIFAAEHVLEKAGACDIAYVLMNSRGEVVRCNSLFTETFGDFPQWGPAEWLRVVHPDDRARLLARMHQADIVGTDKFEQDFGRYRRKDGQYVWMVTCSAVEHTLDGSATYWHCFYNQLPPISFMEERINVAVKDSDTRYHALFDHSSDATLLLFNGSIVDCNPAAAALYGFPKERLLGLKAGNMLAERQSNGQSTAEVIEKIKLAAQSDGVVRVISTVQPLDGGDQLETESTVVSVTLGGATYQLVTIRDITDFLRTENELKCTNQTLALQNANLSWLQEMSARIFAAPDLESLGEDVIRGIKSHYKSPEVSFYLREDDIYRVISASFDHQNFPRGHMAPRNPTMDHLRAAPDQLLVVTDFAAAFGADSQISRHFHSRNVQAIVAIMLLDHDEELGVLTLEYTYAKLIRRDDLEVLKVFVRTLALVVARHKNECALQYQANHDTLTGLHNRNVLHQAFDLWRRGPNGPATLLLLDLDRFKEINDTLGHHIGDDLLCQIGTRITATLDTLDALLCRLGGDEFAVLIRGQGADTPISLAIAQQVLDAIRQPFTVNAVPLEISASIGVALYPQQGENSHELLRFADVAMYEAKRIGAGVMLYDTQLDQNSPQRLRLIIELNNAIRGGELVLHYQPKVDLRTQAVIGCEALVRWQHPVHGLLMPDVFVPPAEVGEAIHALTAFVIAEAIAQHQRWRSHGLDLPIAVNLSARNLIDDRVLRQLEILSGQGKLIPGALELEITETSLMQDPERAILLLQRIAALGVQLAIDDFGTGYSSFAYLRHLPIDTLKIDRMFVQNMEDTPRDMAIMQSMVALAHHLDKRVVAEGVELSTTLDALRAMDCDMAQGHILSAPLPADALEEWIGPTLCRN